MKVETDAPLFYRYLTDRERQFRQRDHPLKLSDVTALGSHYGEFEISEEELDALVEESSKEVSDYKDIIPDLSGSRAHHRVWIGRWELGMSGDRELMYAKEVHEGNPEGSIPPGTCYEDAWRFLIKKEEGFLVHGTVRLYEGGREVKHAWVELPSGHVWEPQTNSYFTLKDFEITSPIEEHRYSVEEAAIMAARVGKHGPWTEEERRIWL